MSIEYTGSPNSSGGTTLGPGAGSTGFTSGGVAFANSSGQLTATTGFTFSTVGGSTGGCLLVKGDGSTGVRLALFTNTTVTDAFGLALETNQIILTAGANGAATLGGTTGQRVGFFGSIGTTKQAAYTAGTTGTRAVPTTVSTAAQTTAEVKAMQNAINDLIGVVSNLIKDDQGHGFRR